MFTYIYQTISKAYKFLATTIKYLDDSKDQFESGDINEEREETKYVVLTREIPKTKKISSDGIKIPQKPRAKAIVTGKYGKRKGEKVPEWRRRIICKYNELKHVNYSTESKYYTTAKINDFIIEIEDIEETECEECGKIHYQ